MAFNKKKKTEKAKPQSNDLFVDIPFQINY